MRAHHVLGTTRLGAITGIPTGPQNKTRALLAGLVALAKRTTTPVRVIVQLTRVWEAWTQKHHRQAYNELFADLTEQDMQRITVLYVSRNTSFSEAPAWQPCLSKSKKQSQDSLHQSQSLRRTLPRSSRAR